MCTFLRIAIQVKVQAKAKSREWKAMIKDEYINKNDLPVHIYLCST